MDARITRQRLGNMLSYDWLKILGAIVAAALLLSVFFVMIATRATDGQKFYVYAYNGLQAGTDFHSLSDTMSEKNVFSYEILDSGSEVFSDSKSYGDTVFSARRYSGEGRVMFISDRREEKDGKQVSALTELVTSVLEDEGEDNETFDLFLDPQEFLKDTRAYLVRFFGEDLKGEPNAAETHKAFIERNKKDKRFRTEKKKQEGVELEGKRLKKLRDDYLQVEAALGTKLDFVTCDSEKKTYTVGFSMSALNLVPLVYDTVEEDGQEVRKSTDIVLTIFNNGTREGDLKYETVSFLAYLLNAYGSQS